VEPFETDPGGRLAAALVSAAELVDGEPPSTIGVPAWTDAHNFVDLAGSQAIVWGPGDFDLAHDPDEAVDVAEVVGAARIVSELLSRAEGWVT
jgi:acetylornithine deacetylase/succinyl-diaminopimelate desuccinylase-like protein